MKKDEGLEAFRKRLETCFRLHSGIRPNEHAYRDLLKDRVEPTVEACVNGESLIFLVDTGAAMSVINCKAMIKPPMSNEIVKTIGASGLPLREQVTMPLPVSFCEEKCQHQFLYSDHCPVNLMGRDLLCKLGINITCGRTGLTVIHEEEEEDSAPHVSLAKSDRVEWVSFSTNIMLLSEDSPLLRG
ncbi:unnamed protein product, partial [Oncorhynchus mykiss]